MAYPVSRRRLLLIRRQEISPNLMLDELIRKIHGDTRTHGQSSWAPCSDTEAGSGMSNKVQQRTDNTLPPRQEQPH